jgi:hypothetical protein
MKYGIIKNDYKNIKRYVSFKLIEEIVVYNKGVFLEEFTRFKGDESYVIYDDGKITLTHNEDDATVFTSNDKGQVAFLNIINKIKSGEIKYEGILVIEYNELHTRSSEVLQYPNEHYRDLIQPIKIYDGESIEKAKARERRHYCLCEDAYDALIGYIDSRGWKLSDDEISYINTLDYPMLEHLLRINRGRNNYISLKHRRR